VPQQVLCPPLTPVGTPLLPCFDFVLQLLLLSSRAGWAGWGAAGALQCSLTRSAG